MCEYEIKREPNEPVSRPTVHYTSPDPSKLIFQLKFVAGDLAGIRFLPSVQYFRRFFFH
jgi:hypothetical protein